MTHHSGAPHRVLSRDLLDRACDTLVHVHETTIPQAHAPRLNPVDISRLRRKTAGFACVVKAARALGLMIEIRLARPATEE